MKVILLKDIPKIGKKYEVKEFKQGYAQNVLLAKGLAEIATPHALMLRDAALRKLQNKEDTERASFEESLRICASQTIEIFARTNEKGHLFKAVSARDTAQAIKDATGITFDERAIKMDPLKECGTHTIRITEGKLGGECQIRISPQK
jgi:large subunit ribosomal protein L9